MVFFLKFNMKSREHELQKACFTWFGYQYPKYKMLLFAIPNGSQRHIAVAVKLKAEGVTAGVLDMFLAVPNPKYHGLFIEFKYGKNTLSDNQKDFISKVEPQGFKTVVIYDQESFREEINNYL